MSLLGCVGDPLIEVEDATGAVIAAAVPIDGRTVSADITANLPAAALTFSTFPEDRIVLFDTRIIGGRYDPLGVAAPRIARAPAGLGPASPRTLAVPEGNWRGLRSYDLGSCSFYLPWQTLDFIINGAIVNLLEADPDLAGVAVQIGRLRNTGPILRSVGNSNTDDQLRYNATIGIATAPGCDSATLDVETRYAVFTESEATMPDLSCGGVIDTPGATDVGVAVLFSQAEQRDPFCASEGPIETRLAAALATRLPEAFATYIEDITRFPAGGALPADPCECDADCSFGPRGPLQARGAAASRACAITGSSPSG